MRVADPACISTWFPMLAVSGVPVPKTEIIAGAPADLLAVLDGKPVTGLDGFIARVCTAAERLGYPAFLRSGHLSGKHGWRRTCTSRTAIASPATWSRSGRSSRWPPSSGSCWASGPCGSSCPWPPAFTPSRACRSRASGAPSLPTASYAATTPIGRSTRFVSRMRRTGEYASSP